MDHCRPHAHFNLTAGVVGERTASTLPAPTTDRSYIRRREPKDFERPSLCGLDLLSPRSWPACGASLPLSTWAVALLDPGYWTGLVTNVNLAKQEQLRVRREFVQAFSMGLVCGGFERSTTHPRYLLYNDR